MNRIGRFCIPLLVAGFMACGGEGGDPAPEDPGADPGGAAGEETGRAAPAVLDRWDVHLDLGATADARFEMEPVDGGFAVTTGPAGITWRPDARITEGDFSVSADFVQQNAPVGHQEGYGIFVGGQNLGDADQQYTYFLVRGDGRYLVKQRNGAATREVVDWTESPEVQGIASDGESVRNRLEVRVRGDQVEFVANGTVVERLPAEDMDPWGVAGLRINHDLDVRVEGWSVQPADGGGAAR